ncbi:DUF6584 family protein [Clavibacter californiensis]|uniref:DUF1707 domain-containing protein n=1 Tax=Clavibacter californiensis TaxID=1401995 RepID=A0ABX9N632_9MICO|nr:DUF6584 family protein [Clavibacter californiensis]RII91381.1 hypothetical protein DZF98_09665 [Clavibacter californiensis]UKF81048.1 hypothetical protein FGD68_05195 [Clavibacter californiensis]
MDEAGAIARAEAMRDAGERARGIQSLRTRVERNPTELEARRILAEWYRDDGTHDQAGRWGIVLPGWTTTYERDRTARLFAASYPVGGDVLAFLHLPAGPIPEDARLLAARIPVQRELLSRRADPPTPGQLPGPPGPLDGYALVVGIVAVVLLLVDIAVTVVGALLGASTSGFTRWVTAGVLVLAVAAVLLAWVNARRTPARPAAQDVDEGVLPADPPGTGNPSGS